MSAITIDGGDQVTSVLTLLLLPLTLTDGRRWHWERASNHSTSGREEFKRLFAMSAWMAIRVQVAAIYFHSSVAKLHVEEWVDGTVLYYWLTNPDFGAPPWLQPTLMPFLTSGAVAVLTWGVIFVEVLLFAALTAPKWAWRPILIVGIVLHTGIALLHGLISFSIAMIAALILYLRPLEKEFQLLFVLRRMPFGRIFDHGTRRTELAITP